MAEFTLSKTGKTFKSKLVDIATGLFELINVEELTTMCYFMDGLCTAFWEPQHKMLKHVDKVTNRSGHVTRSMSIATYIIWREIKKIEVIMEVTFFLKITMIESNHTLVITNQ